MNLSIPVVIATFFLDNLNNWPGQCLQSDSEFESQIDKMQRVDHAFRLGFSHFFVSIYYLNFWAISVLDHEQP